MKKKSIWQRVLAFAAAIVLVAGFVPTTAFASLIGDHGTSTLQIAYDKDGDGKNDLMVNKSYKFFGKKTVADLFAAAKSAGDIADYSFSGGFLSSVTLADGTVVANKSDFTLYWASYKDGAYDDGSSCAEGSALSDGVSLQFGYVGYGTGPTEYAWDSAPTPSTSDMAVGQLSSGTTLQIAYDKDGDGANELVVNSVYGFEDGATLADLFAAAKSAGDIKDYSFSGGYLSTVTLADGTVVANKSDFTLYWASYKDGAYDDGSSCAEGSALSDGASLQFGYEGYPTGPTEVDWAATSAPAISTSVAKKATEPEPTPEPAKAYPYDSKTASTLMANLAARFAKGGSDASIDNSTIDAAIALNALGRGSQIDSAALLKNFEGYSAANDGKAMGAGQYGKYIMALTAAGIDCTKVTLSDGSVHNLVSEMEALVDADGLSVYDEVWVLSVYRSYADASGRTSKLIDDILANTDSAGLFGLAAYGCDTQTSAQAILALLPYRSSRADVRSAIEKAEAAILALQNEDGGFGYSASFAGSNLDATGEVVAALTALGHNCANGSDLTTANGSTPLGWLCGQADADLAGFLDNSSYNETLTSAEALLGLAADAGRASASDVYNLKTVETAKSPEEEKKEPKARPKDDAKPDDAAVPATGDPSSLVLVSGLAAGGALLIAESRRRAA